MIRALIHWLIQLFIPAQPLRVPVVAVRRIRR